MRVILDAFGGDHSPLEIIKGAELALKAKENIEVIPIPRSLCFN